MSVIKEADVEAPAYIITRAKPNFIDLARDLEQVEKLGKWIAKSKFFQLDYEEQGIVIATECYLQNVSILEYAKRNKIVAGKPFVQYDAMLAAFRERGGSHKILSMTPDLASIEITTAGLEKSTHSLSWEDAQQESFPYLGKESDIIAKLSRGEKPELKPKYATPRSRAVMLFARLVSSTIRAICPEVNYGVYTEEEAEDFLRVDAPAAEPVQRPSRMKQPETKGESPVSPMANAFAEANAFSQAVMKRAESSAAMQHVATKADPKPEPQPEPKIPKLAATEGGASQGGIDEPLTEAQRQRIVQLLTEATQAGATDLKQKIMDKLKASGMSKLADMSIAEGNVLISALAEKNASLWLEASLKGPVPS